MAQKVSNAEAKRKQKISELSNSPVKPCNLHQVNGKVPQALSMHVWVSVAQKEHSITK